MPLRTVPIDKERPGRDSIVSERLARVYDLRSANRHALLRKVHHLCHIISDPFPFLVSKRHGIRHEMFAGACILREFSTKQRHCQFAFLKELTGWLAILHCKKQRYVYIGISVGAWSAVLLVVTYWVQTPAEGGPPSLGSIGLLSLLMGIAVMAEDIVTTIVSAWGKQSSTTTVARQR